MALCTDIDTALLDTVRELRRAGRSPKEIARILGIRPSAAGDAVRTIARESPAGAHAGEGDLAGCWVNAGWDAELVVEGHHPEWPRGGGPGGCAGLSTVVVARPRPSGDVSTCVFLVDTHCLGVKNTIGPTVMSRPKLARVVGALFEDYGAPPVEAPLDLARQLVLGAVDYARTLGFEPHRDYRRCAGHLGDWDGDCAIRFGRRGKPMYVSGPYDDIPHVLETLDRAVGRDGYSFLVGLEAAAAIAG